jgi:hypothetical protein
MDLIGLLMALIIVALVVWATRTLLPALGVPPPVATVIHVVVVVLVVLWLVGQLGGPTLVRLR